MNNLFYYIFAVWRIHKHIKETFFKETFYGSNTTVEHITNPSRVLFNNVNILQQRKEQQLKQLEKETNYG